MIETLLITLNCINNNEQAGSMTCLANTPTFNRTCMDPVVISIILFFQCTLHEANKGTLKCNVTAGEVTNA